MKRTLLQLIIPLFILLPIGLHAQDIHFTQFGAAPLQLNPAFTGAFGGEMRVIANYRNQWETVPVPYNTYAFSIDSKIQTLKQYNYFGIGASVYSDEAGDLNFKTNSYQLLLSYNIFLGSLSSRRGDFYMRLGFQGGQINQRFDYDNIHLENPDQEIYVDPSISYLDYGLGMLVTYVEPQAYVYGGLSTYHFQRPNVSFYNQVLPSDITPGANLSSTAGEALFQKLNVQFGGDFTTLDGSISFAPDVLYSRQFVHQELLVGGYLRFNQFKFKKSKGPTNVNWSVGTWYRVGDALILATKWDYSNILSFGISYDMNISNAREATLGYGALEVSISYMLQTKRTKGAPSHSGGLRKRVKCPRISKGPFYENPWYRERGLAR
ncbi:MAG: PorP/SprF family type IX secretion system membrane protein [Bacteroidota bacterium]